MILDRRDRFLVRGEWESYYLVKTRGQTGRQFHLMGGGYRPVA